MTTTPTIWKAPFQPNAASPQGLHPCPRTVGLANGNFLVVWEGRYAGAWPVHGYHGPALFAEGRPLGGVFQVNSSITGSDETGPKIVALPDGGYVGLMADTLRQPAGSSMSNASTAPETQSSTTRF